MSSYIERDDSYTNHLHQALTKYCKDNEYDKSCYVKDKNGLISVVWANVPEISLVNLKIKYPLNTLTIDTELLLYEASTSKLCCKLMKSLIRETLLLKGLSSDDDGVNAFIRKALN
jgi:hypothetical protein